MADFMNALGYGGIVAVIGMMIVFLGLTILIFFVWLMGKVFQAIANKKKAAPAAAPAPAPVAAPVVEAAPAVEDDVVEDTQIIAVIAAALAAYDNGSKNLVIRKVRRVNAWNNTARREQIYKF